MQKIPKFIIDRNIIFSALYSPISNASRQIELALEKKIELFAPEKVKEELKKNLKVKLEMDESEIEIVIKALPVNWLDKKLYLSFIEKASTIISQKDVHILAAHYLTNFPIITGYKEFFQLENIKKRSLKDIVDELEKSSL